MAKKGLSDLVELKASKLHRFHVECPECEVPSRMTINYKLNYCDVYAICCEKCKLRASICSKCIFDTDKNTYGNIVHVKGYSIKGIYVADYVASESDIETINFDEPKTFFKYKSLKPYGNAYYKFYHEPCSRCIGC